MRVGDLFCGCGGMGLGLTEAGMEVAFSADNWDPALDSYEANMGHRPMKADLTDISDAAFRLRRAKVDLIAGGPPCQEFSSANIKYFAGDRREGHRADLTVDFAEIIRAVEPKWFIYENVPEVGGSKAFEAAHSLLSGAGYGICEVVLNAAYHGVPQLRKRFFAIGCLGEDDGFLEDALLERETDEPLTVRQYLGDELGTEFYYRHPRTWDRRAIYSIDEPAATIRSTNRPIPANYKHHPQNAATKDKARPLTAAERGRLQTFPRGSTFCGYNTDKDLMVANAVPVLLARHLGRVILRHEEEARMTGVPKDFEEWLSDRRQLTPRSAGNVASRLRRVQRMLGRSIESADHRDVVHELSKRPEFQDLTVSVRSQLKRAVQLHAEFLVRE
ncbi:MAG: DNA (cytosine-5-)-methyltransferase [Roseomonas sp.]|nr:DNA (cytosine-5-)-methyltransferase [Roseomonas sp.]